MNIINWFKTLYKKWKIRKGIISSIKKQDLSANSLKKYINYIALYDTNVVDECAVCCNVNPITGVYTLIIDGRQDVNVELSLLGYSILLKIYTKDEHSSMERNFGFRNDMGYNSLIETPLVDCSDTLEDINSILCNSILYTIKNYTKRWWKNEKGVRNHSK